MYTVRRFRDDDAEEVVCVIRDTLRRTNIKDYAADFLEGFVLHFTPESMKERASETHFYVVCGDDRIIGCGAIGPYLDREDESCLYNVYILPEYQGKGVGTKIIETLEQDEYFYNTKRTEVPSSITAREFYLKMGYDYKDGNDQLEDEERYRLEKFR